MKTDRLGRAIDLIGYHGFVLAGLLGVVSPWVTPRLSLLPDAVPIGSRFPGFLCPDDSSGNFRIYRPGCDADAQPEVGLARESWGESGNPVWAVPTQKPGRAGTSLHSTR